VPQQNLRSADDLQEFLIGRGVASLPGLNVQEPWASLLLSGRKTIETRTYTCPSGFLGVPVGLVATRRANDEKAALIGVVRIESCVRYDSLEAFRADEHRHLVTRGSDYDWIDRSKPKWGWTVLVLATCSVPFPLQGRRGIVWTRELLWSEPQ
jgi:hypothetical protein